MALLARGYAGLDAAAADVEKEGGRALPIVVDVADHEAVEAAATRVEDVFGHIDVWVNVAFTSVFARFEDIEPAEFERVTDVAYHGYVNGTRAALRRMRPRDQGVIVQVGSALGHRGIPLQSAYCGAKHALEGFHDSVRTELMHDRSGVRVTMVEMPAVNTPQFTWVLSRLPNQAQPVPPIYQPEVAARAVLHAAGHPNRRAAGSAPAPLGRSWPTGSPVVCWTATWPGSASAPNRPISFATPTSRPTCGSPSTARRDTTSAPTASSTHAPTPGVGRMTSPRAQSQAQSQARLRHQAQAHTGAGSRANAPALAHPRPRGQELRPVDVARIGLGAVALVRPQWLLEGDPV